MKIFKNRNLCTYFLSVLASIFGVALNFSLAKILKAEAYGNFQFYISIITTTSNFLIFGLNTFLIREAKNNKVATDIFSKCVSLYTCTFLFGLPIIYFVLNNFVLENDKGFLFAITLIFVSFLFGLNVLISSYNQGKGKLHLSIIFETLIPKLFLTLSVFILLFFGKINFFEENFLVFYLIIYFVIVTFFIIKLFKKISFSFSFADIKSIVFFFGITINYTLASNLTKVFQGVVFNDFITLGIISISLSVMNLVDVFTNVFTNICKPIFAKLHREGKGEQILDLYNLNTRVSSYIALPMYIFLFSQSANVLLFFDESYIAHPEIMQILVLYSAVSCLTGPNGTMLSMTGKEKWEFFNGVIYVVSFLGFVVLFRNDPILGLSLSLCLGQVVVNIAKYIEVWTFSKKPPLSLKTILILVLVCLVDFALIFWLRFLNNYILWIILSVLMVLTSILLNTIILPITRKDVREMLKLKL